MSNIKSKDTQENYDNTKNINGPIGAYRLEGKINGIKKILYLFADFHIYEYKCPNDFSLDINQYIVREFSKINNSSDKTEYDFFLEIYPGLIYPSSVSTKKASTNYLNDLRYTFEKYINFDEVNNKMVVSKFGEKSRLHYIDIRGNVTNKISFHPHIFLDLQSGNIYRIKESIHDILMNMVILLSILSEIPPNSMNKQNMTTTLIDILKNKEISNEFEEKQHTDYFRIIIDKLYRAYTNLDIKQIIVNELSDIVTKSKTGLESLSNLYDKINKFIQYYNSMNNNLTFWNGSIDYGVPYMDKLSNVHEWTLEYATIHDAYQTNMANLMDLYFIRRFLDKSYINHGIVFTGAAHTMNIIYMLMNKFGFKLTNSNINKYDIHTTNKMIAKINKNNIHEEMAKILLPDTLTQCTDMSSFPESFL
jgi:hypothetical protein